MTFLILLVFLYCIEKTNLARVNLGTTRIYPRTAMHLYVEYLLQHRGWKQLQFL